MNLTVRIERWPLQRAFTISRGSKTEAVVVVAELESGGQGGRGEAVPYLRYGETPEGVAAALEAMAAALRGGLNRDRLQTAMPAGAARRTAAMRSASSPPPPSFTLSKQWLLARSAAAAMASGVSSDTV